MKVRADWTNRIMLFAGGILLILPFMIESRSLLITLTQIFIFAIFAMSYDILLGYTGIVSFGHAMFFGIGAYTTGIFLQKLDSNLVSFSLSILVAITLSFIISLIVGLLTLRLKSTYYAMLTLALANLFLVVAEKWRSLTLGNDGFTFRVPELLQDRTNFYFICLFLMLAVFFLLKRFTHSPLGTVFVAIRENEQRADSFSLNPLYYKVIATVVSGVIATVSGSLYGISLRFVNTSVFSLNTTLDALLMTIVGGVGTLIGPIIGAGFIEFAHQWLTSLADVHPIFERWIIFFGTVYILVVIFFPQGIVGFFRQKFIFRRKMKKHLPQDEKIAG